MFNDKVVLVTGAASGIGAKTSEDFVTQGATVFGLDLNEAGLQDMARQLGDKFIAVCCDMTSNDDLKAAAELIQARSGRLDVLVNNAGIGTQIPLSDIDNENFELFFGILLRGPMLLVKHCTELLRASEAPAVINISSICAQLNWGDHMLYSCAKAGIDKFTRHLVRDLPWIRSNTIMPGLINTPILDPALDEEQKEALIAGLNAEVPCGRIGDSADIANAILFLASDNASYINGVSLQVDGGLRLAAKTMGYL
jgi:NAD(P)-dependent dehydrogenase (short-subunit alcohol dehydrogenase family)